MSPPEAVLGVFVFGGAFWVLRPLVAALAKRVAGETGRASAGDELTALRNDLLDEMRQVRHDVNELAERVDFTERLLAKQREAERLGPSRGP
jgi:hypothetical protein